MKTELKLAPHSVIPDQQCVELWYDGQLIGTVYGAIGPGVKLITKFQTDPPFNYNSMEQEIFINRHKLA